jgi:translation initiation factor IF-2
MSQDTTTRKRKMEPKSGKEKTPAEKQPSSSTSRRGQSTPTKSAKPRSAEAGDSPSQKTADQTAPAEPQEKASPSNAVIVPATITVRDLAALLDVSPINLIRELMKNGVMANINQEVDFETAAIVAADLGFEVQEERPPEPEEEAPETKLRKRREYSPEELAKLVRRPPVVTIMGHVDHGKTSLLDVIRQTDVVASEAGGITQHIGAYQIQKQDKRITFLDTPGHEAFTAMRARGAMATDIAVLVVAADDGVQPQTLEAISHARAAQVPIVVALNKIDKANANPEAVKKQLSDVDLIVEDYGGEIICVPVSAKQKIGLENLLEMLLLVADMADLKALSDGPAEGVVLEGRMDKSRGTLATVLIQDGELHVGDSLVIGDIAAKVRAMFDDKGERIDEAGPSTPAMILGLSEVPTAGASFRVVEDERTAKELAEAEAARQQEAAERQKHKTMSLDDFFAQAQEGGVKELNIILKADVQGSIEPIVNSVEKLGDEMLRVQFLHAGTGNISESDVMLAVASDAIVIGFNVQADAAATRMAESEGVDIRLYNIIYNLVDDIDKALKGLLEPTYKDVVIGHAVVRAIFRIGRRKQAAGCQVTDGIAARNAMARLLRDENVLFDGAVASLRRFKDDVREVTTGMECGVGLDGFHDFAEGDVIEFYRKEQV